jgi:hypothetical protein
MTAVNTTATLAAGTVYLIFTADATNGSYVHKLRFRPNPGSAAATTATVARIWLNNGSTTTTATNNILWDEITLPSVTLVQTAQTMLEELPLGFMLPPGWRIYGTLGTASTTNGWHASVIGGDY